MFFKRKDDGKEERAREEIMRAMEPEPPQEEFIAPPQAEKPTSAPLFIKVEKYQSILESLNEMRQFVSSMKQLYNVIHELETVRADSLKIMRANVQRFEKSLVEIDSELLRPKGLDMSMPYNESEVAHVEDSLTELQRQLADLRRELQELK